MFSSFSNTATFSIGIIMFFYFFLRILFLKKDKFFDEIFLTNYFNFIFLVYLFQIFLHVQWISITLTFFIIVCFGEIAFFKMRIDLKKEEEKELIINKFEPLISLLDNPFNEYKDAEISSKIKERKESILSMIDKIRNPYGNRYLILLKDGTIFNHNLNSDIRFYYDGTDFIFDKKQLEIIGRNESIIRTEHILNSINRLIFTDLKNSYSRAKFEKDKEDRLIEEIIV